MKIVRIAAVAFVTVAGLVACSSSDSSSGGSSCAQAKQIADDCNAKPQDGGASITITFDQNKCEQSDQGKKAADCIVANKDRCDCVASCSLTGSCS